MTRCACLLSVGLLVICLAGCGGAKDDQPARVPVQVKVTYKNAPVEGAHVTFAPTQSGRPAWGTTDAEGVAHLSTFGDNDGAIPGQYQVTVSKTKVEGGEQVDPNQPSSMAPNPNAKPTVTLNLLPKKYSVAATSGLKAEVPEKGDKKFDFTLTD
ncbi:MAG: carboxypeptidase-like regulatory domain-containing protein [Thermoguttaceae bacterium]